MPSSSTFPIVAVLQATSQSWLSRRWVRMCLLLALFTVIGATFWSIPRQASAWVRSQGGEVSCQLDSKRADTLLAWWNPSGSGWPWGHFEATRRALSRTRRDDEITFVSLSDSPVLSQDLFNLRPFQRLKGAGLHSRQIGPGLAVFRELLSFRELQITGALSGQFGELRQLPQLESVGIWNPQSGEIGMGTLSDLPRLKSLSLGDCKPTATLLGSMPELPKLEDLVIQNCTGFGGDDLSCLERLPGLRNLDLLSRTGALNDTAFEHMSRLEHLETLALRMSWTDVTDAGLEKLSQLKSLKNIYLWRIQCTSEQISRLQKAVPNCTVVY